MPGWASLPSGATYRKVVAHPVPIAQNQAHTEGNATLILRVTDFPKILATAASSLRTARASTAGTPNCVLEMAERECTLQRNGIVISRASLAAVSRDCQEEPALLFLAGKVLYS